MDWWKDTKTIVSCRCGKKFISADGMESDYSEFFPICEICAEEEESIQKVRFQIEELQKKIIKSEMLILDKAKKQEILSNYEM